MKTKMMQRNKVRIRLLLAMAFGLVVSSQSAQLAAQDSSDHSRSSNKIKAEVQDGKIIVTTPDGETHQIDLGELKGGKVLLHSEIRSDDGKKSGSSRAILVGPEGTNQQLIFDDSFGDAAKFEFFPELKSFAWSSDGGIPNLQTIQLNNQFVIGINCHSVSDAMKAQMDLENGLVVETVSEDSAASDAGLQQHDILVRAEGESLEEIEDLTAVIQAAGKDESPIKIKLIRKGKEKTVTVTPRERSDAMLEYSGDIQRLRFDMSEVPDGTSFSRVLPGLIRQSDDVIVQMQEVEASDMDSMAKEMAELRKLVEQLREEMRNDK